MNHDAQETAIDSAYELAVHRMDIDQKRWDSVNQSFIAMFTISLSLVVALPIGAKGLGIEKFALWWVFALIFCFLVSVACCFYGRFLINYRQINLQSAFEASKRLNDRKFRFSMIQTISGNIDINNDRIKAKKCLFKVVGASILLQILLNLYLIGEKYLTCE